MWEERASQMVLVVKNLPANAEDVRDTGSIPGSGRSPGEGHRNPLQHPCLEHPMERGACRVLSIGSQRVKQLGSLEWKTRLKWLSTAHNERKGAYILSCSICCEWISFKDDMLCNIYTNINTKVNSKARYRDRLGKEGKIGKILILSLLIKQD